MKTLFNLLGTILAIFTGVLVFLNVFSPINPFCIITVCAMTILCMFISHTVYGEVISNRTFVVWIALLIFWIFLSFSNYNKIKIKEEHKTEIIV